MDNHVSSRVATETRTNIQLIMLFTKWIEENWINFPFERWLFYPNEKVIEESSVTIMHAWKIRL